MNKTLAELIAEAQALSSVAENQFEADLATLVADLQAFVPVTPAPTDPIATITVLTQGGVSSVFTPEQAVDAG